MAEEENNVDDDAAAAEWEAMMAAEEGGDGGEGGDAAAAEGAEGEDARVLNQDEIDLLLGFDSGDDGIDPNSGIMAILDKSMMAYEKLPMLEVVFDRLVRMLSTSLRTFTSDNVDVSIDSMSSLRFEDYLNSIPLPALLGVFRANEWENFGICTIDSSQIYSTVDILLGGRRATRPIRIEGRPYTTIEQDIVKKVIDIVLTDMSTAFDPLSPVTFQFDRLENNPRFASITRPNSAALLVRLRVDMDERGGMIEILFPHNTLEPIRDLLLQMFMGEKFGQDSVWERHLGKEVQQTYIDLDVVLDELAVDIGKIINLKVGDTMMLETRPDDVVAVKSGGVQLTSGKLGKVGDRLAVSLVDEIKQTKEEIAEWLM
ncbi:MAG: flagellar motor switch protein FliM [Rickettsiales bacterium]|nr:flagellar motor switch protein FliM [Rickettsiales bacterium]